MHGCTSSPPRSTRSPPPTCAAPWPSGRNWRTWGEALLDQYVAINPGFQRFAFAGGRVVLTLLVGDALDTLPQLDARVDAWFLDGFSPAKNPQMWIDALYAPNWPVFRRRRRPWPPSPAPVSSAED